MEDKDKKVVELDLNDILPNRFQPRIKFNEEKIYELSQSIKEHGVIQPIIVRPIGDKYEIVTGERRYKASVLAGLETIPTIILDLQDKDSIELALIENVQREDLSPIEEAISYKKILDMGYLTQEELAEKLGVSQSAIANKKRLLNLCDEVQEALMEKEISERHARSLLKIQNEDLQQEMLYRIVSEKLTVRQLDLEIQKMLENNPRENIKFSSEEETEINNQKKSEKEYKNNEKNEESKLDNTINSIDNELNLDDILSSLINFEDEDESKIDKESLKIETLEDDKIFKDDGIISTLDEKNVEINQKESKNIEEKKEKNGENENMNNMFNLGNEIAYNNLKGSTSTTGGKFFGTAIEDDEDEIKTPVVTENKSVFDFSTGMVSDNTQNSVTLTRDSSAETTNQSSIIAPVESSNELSNKMNDLLSPQGSLSSFENENKINQERIFSSSNPQSSIFGTLNTPNEESTHEGETSIFSNLMKSNDSSNSMIDSDELQSFLDPSFVNGQKQNTELNNNQINDSIFEKFIDEDFGGEINPSKESTMSETTNDLLSKNLFSTPTSMYRDNSESTVDLSELKNEVPEINNSQNDSIFEQAPSIKMDNEKLDINNLDNSSSQTELIAGLMASSKKPDLLAPMNNDSSEENNEVLPLNSIFGINQTGEKEDNNVFESKLETNPSTFDFSGIKSSLSLNSQTEDNKKIEEEKEEEPTSIPETIEKPVFITATNEETNISAPKTPIITDTTMSNLLSVEKKPIIEQTDENVEQSIQEEKEESIITDSEEKEDIPTPTTNNNIDIQPIIITDYNKQYDPVLPVKEENKEPTINFKQILGMLRDLSNKIEEYGYTIDTEEIDLENIYQVIFNITKK